MSLPSFTVEGGQRYWDTLYVIVPFKSIAQIWKLKVVFFLEQLIAGCSVQTWNASHFRSTGITMQSQDFRCPQSLNHFSKKRNHRSFSKKMRGLLSYTKRAYNDLEDVTIITFRDSLPSTTKKHIIEIIHIPGFMYKSRVDINAYR